SVYRAVQRAADRARRGEGPTLLELKTFRMRGHEEASGTDYVPPALVEEWVKKDPITRFEAFLKDRRVLDPEAAAALRTFYKARIDALVDEALAAPEPKATAEELRQDVYPPKPPRAPAADARAGSGRFRDAVRRRDQRRPAHRDAPRRARRPARAGHRGVRGGLQGHRGLRPGVREIAGAEHSDRGVGRDRVRNGARPRRLRADGGDAVRRLHLLRLQPGREQPRQDAIPLGRPRGRRPSRPGRRGHRSGPLPLPERRVVVHERRRPQGRGPGDSAGRE